jgi:heme/copper-type cytochrome/quinol oxidase subunit 1
MLAITPPTFQYQDTYFVVARFRYDFRRHDLRPVRRDLFLAAEVDQPHVQRNTRQVHFWLTTIGFNLTLSAALPRLPHAGVFRLRAGYRLQPVVHGGRILHDCAVIFFYIAIRAMKGRPGRSTGLEGADGLEWTLACRRTTASP